MREADHRTRESETCFCCVLVVQDRYSSYELNVIYFFNLNLRSSAMCYFLSYRLARARIVEVIHLSHELT